MVVAAIVTLVIAAAGLVNYVISNYYALESVRAALKFNSESILSGINNLMMSRNNDGVLEFIQDISKDSAVYRDIRLVSHYSGEIVVSRLGEATADLSEEDRSCAICHDRSEPTVPSGASLDEVIAGPGGTRMLHVITPIANQDGCKTADCHAHLDSGPTLGFLQAEYSLARIDALLSYLNASFVIAALAAILLGTLALWVMFRQTLGKFDHMASRIEAHQTQLRDAREYLEGIVENSADIIITVNPKGLIETVNRGAEQALAYRRDELVGQSIELLFADPRERDVAIARLEDDDHVANYETRFLTKDGAVRDVLLTLSRLRDRDGNAIGTIGISKDITTEKELKDLLTQAQAAAAIGQAVTAIQHAIKNMLNTLTGGAYLVRHGMAKQDHERIEEGIVMVDEGISTIGSLSLNLLKYAKKWTLELESVDLALLIEEVCKSVKQTASDEGVKIDRDIPEQLPLVSCDSQLVRMALMDLATNALDACFAKCYKGKETAEVLLNAYLEKGRNLVVVEVEDNGIGMDEETRANAFAPFFTTKGEAGTGLGLALTSRIVKLHGGEIEVESKPDEGTRFRMTLPVAGVNTNQGAEDGQ